MVLDRDEFLVSYDSALADSKVLIATIRKSGYSARVVGTRKRSQTRLMTDLPRGFPLLDEALRRAKAENKPIVLDLYAEWCAPCRKLELLTFSAPRIRAMLERTIFFRIDTDKYPDIAQRLGVEGLPDVRFALPNGKIVRQLRSFQDQESFGTELDQLLQRVMDK